MNTKKYRLIRRQHFRAATIDNQASTIKFVKGDILVPTDDELRFHANAFELADQSAPEGTPRAPESPTPAEPEIIAGDPKTTDEWAARELRKSADAFKDTARRADIPQLEALLRLESQRQGGARKKIVEMLERRQKALLASGRQPDSGE